MNRRGFLQTSGLGAVDRLLSAPAARDRPNILFCLGDNHSWSHVGAYGCKAIRTPHFDRVAQEGVLFRNAFCGTPSCAPSRGGILTGQDAWRLEEGGNLCGTLPAKFPVYTDLLEQAGYHIGYTGKGYSPASIEAGGRTRSPVGPAYKSFTDFLRARPAGKPFCFWFGGFDSDVGVKPLVTRAIRVEDVEIPPFLPDNEVVRNEFIRYFHKIEHFDAGVGRLLETLEQIHELANTLVVVTCDNGMHFPRCYPNLYDYASREYLMIRWGDRVEGNRVVSDFINLIDMAPTFLEAAGLKPLEAMTGRSLVNILTSGKRGRVELGRDRVITGRERHAWVRRGGLGYPMRAIRTEDFLYIRNYEPGRWPAGDPDFDSWPQSVYGDIDRGDTKTYMLQHREDPGVRPLFELSCGKRPSEELYDLKTDPHQMKNVAPQERYRPARRRLAEQLDAHLKLTGDPRVTGAKQMWDLYEYHCKRAS